MSTLLFWAILILCVGLMLLVAELFVPSGGVLGVLAALAVIGSVVLAFRSSADHGLVFLLIVAVAIPAVLAFGLQMWPKTPLGRRMLLSAPSPKDIDPRDSRDLELVSLIGQVGRTITPLRPSGMTEIAGRRVDTITEGMMIEADTPVRVIEVRGKRVLVRKLERNFRSEESRPQSNPLFGDVSP